MSVSIIRNRKTHVDAKTRPVGARSDTSTSCALSVHEVRPGASSRRYAGRSAGSSRGPRMNIYSPAPAEGSFTGSLSHLLASSITNKETKTKRRVARSLQSIKVQI